MGISIVTHGLRHTLWLQHSWWICSVVFCQQLDVSRPCPTPDAPTWYNPAGVLTCIDHWLVSPSLLGGCRAEVLPFDRFPSDHCGVNLDLPTKLD